MRDAAQQLGAAVEHAAAPPARRVEHRRQRGAQLVEHARGRASRRGRACSRGRRSCARRRCRPSRARRRPPGDLLEHAVELGRARRRRPRARAAATASRAASRRSSPDVSASSGRSARSGNGPIGSGVVTPAAAATASIAHVSKCTTRSRSSAPERTAIASPSRERAPGQRPEEADRVVLGAVALPVAADDVRPAAPARRAARRAGGELVDRARERLAALPRHRLAERRVARHRGEPRAPRRARTRRAPRPGSPSCGPRSRATGSSRP